MYRSTSSATTDNNRTSASSSSFNSSSSIRSTGSSRCNTSSRVAVLIAVVVVRSSRSCVLKHVHCNQEAMGMIPTWAYFLYGVEKLSSKYLAQ